MLFLHENERDFRFFCGPQTTPRSLTCTRLHLHSPIQKLGLGEGSRSHRVGSLWRLTAAPFISPRTQISSRLCRQEIGAQDYLLLRWPNPFLLFFFHLVSRLNESKPSEQNSKANTAMIIFSQEFLVKPLKKKTLVIFSSLKTRKTGTARSTSITHQSRLIAWQIWTNLTRF